MFNACDGSLSSKLKLLKAVVSVARQKADDLTTNVAEIDAHAVIEIDRKEIDALDSKIIELIQSRRRISFRIQQHRLGGGGPRTVLAREMVVIDRYRQALGSEGTTLVTDILRVCRGPAPMAAAADRSGPAT